MSRILFDGEIKEIEGFKRPKIKKYISNEVRIAYSKAKLNTEDYRDVTSVIKSHTNKQEVLAVKDRLNYLITEVDEMSFVNFVETIEKIMKSPNQFDKQDWDIWNKMKELYEEFLNEDSETVERSE